jgi:hypothetical protein
MNIYQSYTYLIGWTQHNKWYYGVRFGNKCKPEDDLWIKYFTSSNTVKSFYKQVGHPDVVQIRKKFNNYIDAIAWEEKVLRKLNVLIENKWMNRNIAGAILPLLGKDHPRFGTITSFDVRAKISLSKKER